MKLRNKKTGEIYKGWLTDLILKYDSLAELNEEWEDYEEPKEYWYISHNGIIGCLEYDNDWQYLDFNWQDRLKKIGNLFTTREEAEKAVEKLKAWKRLKDHNLCIERGQRLFVNADNKLTSQKPLFVINTYDEVEDDLDLLFGGEE